MMKDALGKWLEKQGVEVGIDTAKSICDNLGLDSEKKDACLGLVYRFEKGEVDEPEFMQGLLLLSGKSPEEVMGILGGMKANPLDEAKLKEAYDWLKAEEAKGGVGVLGGWAGFRHHVYNREVLKITPGELAKIPIHRRELPPYTWNIPPEYMVAYFRIGRGMTKTDAIKEVEQRYIPQLKQEGLK